MCVWGGVEIDCLYLTSEASTGYIFCLRCSPYLFSFHEFPNANGSLMLPFINVFFSLCLGYGRSDWTNGDYARNPSKGLFMWQFFLEYVYIFCDVSIHLLHICHVTNSNLRTCKINIMSKFGNALIWAINLMPLRSVVFLCCCRCFWIFELVLLWQVKNHTENLESNQHIACQHWGRTQEMSVYSEGEGFYYLWTEKSRYSQIYLFVAFWLYLVYSYCCLMCETENALAHQACVLRSDLEKALEDNASLFSKIGMESKVSYKLWIVFFATETCFLMWYLLYRKRRQTECW